jgi:hypothetical protein
LNTSGYFQITGKHIKEMRDSVEKLLSHFGLTKIEYFNYDEEGNHIIHPDGDKVEWTDPITEATDLQKFQVKYIHIEDLRHFIQSILTFWRETWTQNSPSWLFNKAFSSVQPPWPVPEVPPTSDNEDDYQAIIYADNRWSDLRYYYSWSIGQSNHHSVSMQGEMSLNLSPSNFLFSSQVSASCEDGLRNLRISFRTYMRDASAYIGRTIKSSTTISWSGSLSGGCSVSDEAMVWGCVKLGIDGAWPNPSYEVCLISYGTNSLQMIPRYVPGFQQIIAPISWGSSINLWNLLISLGIAPNGYLTDISIDFINDNFGSTLSTNPQTYSRSLTANIANITITE